MSILAKSASPWWRRLHHAWLALNGRQRHKSNDTRFVEFGGLRLKQVAFSDSAEASRVEAQLRETANLNRFPRFVFRLENTVWVRFLPGHKPKPGNAADVSAMTDFFVDLYRARAVEQALHDTGLHRRLVENLNLLGEVGRLDPQRVTALESLAERIRPERVWMGLDYIDALAKNFSVADGRAMGIDIEAIHSNALLGTGLAKAAHRWLGHHARPVIEHMNADGGPDLQPQWLYAQLHFLAGYGIQNLVRGKAGRIRVEAFDALLSGPAHATDAAAVR